VPPNRESFSATETAEAKSTLSATIIHPDLSTSSSANFEFGLRALERQLVIRPGDFANFADVQFLGVNNSTVDLFQSFKDNGDRFNPRFSLDSVTATVNLGTLEPGDTVSYIYQLTAQGTTLGGEQGYVAFLGDPFGAEVTSGNLVLSTTSLPEPATWMLSVIGLGCIVVVLGVRRRRRRVDPPHALARTFASEVDDDQSDRAGSLGDAPGDWAGDTLA
jgi:hypothetical protein